MNWRKGNGEGRNVERQKEEIDRGDDEEEHRHIKEMGNEKPASPIESKLTGNPPGNTQDAVAVEEISSQSFSRKIFEYTVQIRQINLPFIRIKLYMNIKEHPIYVLRYLNLFPRVCSRKI